MPGSPVSLSARARRELVAQIAPVYREASVARKGMLLDHLVEMTGYARKYAIMLLQQEPQSPLITRRPRSPRYGSEVQQVLMLAWRTARYICARRLIPFLPSLLPYLERKGCVQLSEEQRGQLLAMSSATAERLLRTQRKPTRRGLATTKAGRWLKHQIPIRTFAGWEDERTLSPFLNWQLLLYLDRYRLKAAGTASDDVIFCSDTHQPLTSNAMTLLLVRRCCVIPLRCAICKLEETRASCGRHWDWTRRLPSPVISS